MSPKRSGRIREAPDDAGAVDTADARGTATPTTDAGPAVSPATRKGRRTRASLIRAARVVFERKGFFDTGISDIADEAGLAYGTVYRYFPSKEAIFREVALAVQDEMLHYGSRPRLGPGATPYESIREANRVFLEAYRDNARIIAVIDQAAASNDELREIRKAARVDYVRRAERGLVRLQRQGLANPALDPWYTANALGSMLDRFAFIWFTLEEDFDMDTAVLTLTDLWTAAIGLRTDASRQLDHPSTAEPGQTEAG